MLAPFEYDFFVRGAFAGLCWPRSANPLSAKREPIPVGHAPLAPSAVLAYDCLDATPEPRSVAANGCGEIRQTIGASIIRRTC